MDSNTIGSKREFFNWTDRASGKKEWFIMANYLRQALLNAGLVNYANAEPYPLDPLGPRPGRYDDHSIVDPTASDYISRAGHQMKISRDWDFKAEKYERGFMKVQGILSQIFHPECAAARIVQDGIDCMTTTMNERFPSVIAALTLMYKPSTEQDIALLKKNFMELNDENKSIWQFIEEYHHIIGALTRLGEAPTSQEKLLVLQNGITNINISPLVIRRITVARVGSPANVEEILLDINNALLAHPQDAHHIKKSNTFVAHTTRAKVNKRASEEEENNTHVKKLFKSRVSYTAAPGNHTFTAEPRSSDAVKTVPRFCMKCGRNNHTVRDCNSANCIRCKEALSKDVKHYCTKFVSPNKTFVNRERYNNDKPKSTYNTRGKYGYRKN